MIDDEKEPVIVFSNLGGRYTRQDVTVEVHIYRGENESDWILEVQDSQGGSTLWDDRFDSDEAALAEFRRALKDEGIHSFVVDARKTLH